MKKKSVIIIILLVIVIISFITGFLFCLNKDKEKPLPKPELAEGIRGEQYGIDKNINESTIDNYLNRSDTVYRDVRPLEDVAPWENKGGDRFISAFIPGFEVVPYIYLAGFSDKYIEEKKAEGVEGLYQGDSLFTIKDDGSYTANYEESLDILEYLFPKDKNIFIMCGAGGYAGLTKNMLVALGWDENKIYNIGGFWFYEGKNSEPVKRTVDGKDYYDFWKLNYHDIDFKNLRKK